jgi:dihydroorotate dehydrogenase electron transfer subunit
MINRRYQIKARIVRNAHLTGKYYKLRLAAAKIARIAQPGQFVTLRVSEGYQPLLRRPFSIHRIVHSPQSIVQRKSKDLKQECIEILYEVVGKGTELLSKKKPGQYLDILGPLGKGFSVSDSRYSLLVGGGMGIAPLLFLAQRLIGQTAKAKHLIPLVLIGAKTKKQLLAQKEFASLGCSVKIATDDGSAGFNGQATDLLKHLLSRIKYRESSIYACGPELMLSKIAGIARQRNIPAQISLDEYMACGLGVCLGCMIKTKNGQKLVCRDGPVFDASEISTKYY